MIEFDIIKYIAGILGGFTFDKAVLERIALERGVSEVYDYDELDDRTKALIKADLAFVAYYSPSVWASSTQSHGSYTKVRGAQTIYTEDREKLYSLFYNTYQKYDEAKFEEINNDGATLEWRDW